MALQQLLSFHAFHASDVMRDLYRGAAQLFNLLILSHFSIRYNFVILVQKKSNINFYAFSIKISSCDCYESEKKRKNFMGVRENSAVD